jgi:hypothetical protein
MDVGKPKGFAAIEDILAVIALWIVVLVATGIAFHAVDPARGGGIIVALVAAAGIAKIVKSRRRGSGE